MPVAVSIEVLVAGICAKGLTGVLDASFVAFTVLGCVTGYAFTLGRAKWCGALAAVRIFCTRAVTTGLTRARAAGAGCD